MQREIDSVHSRCQVCGQATWLVVRTTYQDDQGEPVIVVMAEEVPHSAADCKLFVALEREIWPRLFEVET